MAILTPNNSIPIIVPKALQRDFEQASYFQKTNQIVNAMSEYGSSAQRPTTNLFPGRRYFDTQVGSELIWQSPTVGWVFGSNSAFSAANAAYQQANLAYDMANVAFVLANVASNTANAAGNTVAVYVGGSLVLADANVNFNNTATINVSVTANGTIQTNIAFNANQSAVAGPAFDQANLAYAQANSARTTANAASNTVAVFANGTLVLVDSSVNFNNTSSINVAAAANGTGQSNISFVINTSMNLISLNVSGNIANVGNLFVTQNVMAGNGQFLGNLSANAIGGFTSNNFNGIIYQIAKGVPSNTQKYISFGASDGYHLQARDDAEGNINEILFVGRNSGTSNIANLTFGNPTDAASFKFQGNGKVTITGNVGVLAPAGKAGIVVSAASGTAGVEILGAQDDAVRLVINDGTTGAKNWQMRVGAVANGVFDIVNATDGNSVFQATNSTIKFPGIGTTANSSQAYLDPNAGNQLLRSTSSIRYKTNVENLWANVSSKVLEMRPVWFRANTETSTDPAHLSFIGLIAEEVANVEPRLVHWTRDPSGEFVPDGVQYQLLSVMLIDVVKKLTDRVAALEEQLKTLKE